MRFRNVPIPALLAQAVLIGFAPTAHAQEYPAPFQSEASFHLGVFGPRGDSQLWRENQLLFTQDPSDYEDLVIGGAFASHLNRYVDFVIGSEFYDSTVESKYRGYTFDDGGGIYHHDHLRMAPIDFTVKLLAGGRTAARGSGGRFVLRPIVPFIGFGGGALLWDFHEEGTFLDLSDPISPFPYSGHFHARGITPSLNVLAGIEIQLNPAVAMQFEGRYRWAKDGLGSDFAGFDQLDLSGATLDWGMSFRF